MSGHILIVPEEEYRREPEEVRWCFGCRKRTQYELIFTRPTDPMSYYGPRIDMRCTECGEDCSDFPGVYRDGPRYDFAEPAA